MTQRERVAAAEREVIAKANLRRNVFAATSDYTTRIRALNDEDHALAALEAEIAATCATCGGSGGTWRGSLTVGPHADKTWWEPCPASGCSAGRKETASEGA